jgi:hypothetical protein
MQTVSIQWIGEQKFLAVSPSGHAAPFDSDRESSCIERGSGLASGDGQG